MKTTVEIDEALLQRSRELARREGTTLTALIEEGLRAALDRRGHHAPYRWPDLSVGGQGLVPDVGNGTWERVCERIYSGSIGNRRRGDAV